MRAEDAARILLRRRRMRESLVGFAQSIQIPGAPLGGDDSELFAPVGTGMAKHHEVMCAAIQKCLETRYGRLILMLPPGAAKSTYASAIAPAWAMAKWPGYQVILASYATELAKKHARKARAIFKQSVVSDAFEGIGLDRSTSAAELWRTSNGSEFMAAGILAGITGSRADAVIADDLIAGAQEADSPATRSATWEAFEMDLMTRLKPGGSVVLLGTRWHPLDPIGMVLPDDYDGRSGPVIGKDGMTWHVLNIPAEAEHADDPLGRQAGEMLWPEWFDITHWIPWRKKPRVWASLFQQRPVVGGGGSFKEEWIKWYEPGEEPEHLNVYGFSDYAAPNPDAPIDDPDFIEHGMWGLDPDGDVWGLDWWYDQCTTDAGMNAALNLMKKWSPRKWWNEKGPIWNAIANLMSDKLKRNGVRCAREALPSSVNKMLRAETFFGMCEQGRVHLPNVPWAHRLVAQLKAFPIVAHDDGVDVCSLMGRALHKLAYAYVPRQPRDASLKPFSVAWLEYEAPVEKGGRTM